MAISYVGAGALTSGTTSPLTPDVDAVGESSGDLLILIVGTRATAGATVASSGWTHVTSSPVLNTDPAPDIELHILTKVSGGSETDPSVTCSAPGNGWAAMIVGYSGQHASFEDATPTVDASSAANVQCPSITTATNGAVVLNILHGVSGTYTLGTANGFTFRTNGLGNNVGMAVADQTKASAGTVTGCTWTGNSNESAKLTLALKPAAGAATRRRVIFL